VIVRPPFDIAGFDLKQHWHRKFHNDSRNQWIRKQIAQLFNDENDEWSAGWKTAPRSGSSAITARVRHTPEKQTARPKASR
jgi:hypothetical protein